MKKIVLAIILSFILSASSQAQIFVVDKIITDNLSLGIFQNSNGLTMLLRGHFEPRENWDSILIKYDTLIQKSYLENTDHLFMIYEGLVYEFYKSTPFKVLELYNLSSEEKNKLTGDPYKDGYDEISLNNRGEIYYDGWPTGLGVHRGEIVSGNIRITYRPPNIQYHNYDNGQYDVVADISDLKLTPLVLWPLPSPFDPLFNENILKGHYDAGREPTRSDPNETGN